tara:strand:- start:1380 stop:2174 length:795 start_codon:yes stop_codon:yes gene_type:complete
MNSFFRKFNAFLEKDIKIALSYKFNLFIQTILFSFIFLLIFFALQDSDIESSNFNYLNAFLSIISLDFMFSSLNVFSRQVREAKTLGTFETILLTNTSFVTLIFSSYAITFIRMLIRTIVYLSVCKFFFYPDISFFDIISVLLSLLFNSIPFIGLGLISASLIVIFKMGDLSNLLISLLSIFFSGIFFPISYLPAFMSSFGEITPLNVSIETAKLVLSDNFVFSDLLPYFLITATEILLFLPLGIYLINFSLKVAKKEGSLSFY